MELKYNDIGLTLSKFVMAQASHNNVFTLRRTEAAWSLEAIEVFQNGAIFRSKEVDSATHPLR
jgi:hypothetical protein